VALLFGELLAHVYRLILKANRVLAHWALSPIEV
jgi:hypothetical protein